MKKSNIVVAICALTVVTFSVWFYGNYDSISWDTSIFYEAQVVAEDGTTDDGLGSEVDYVYDVTQQQNTLLPLRTGYSVLVNSVLITPMKTIDSSLYDLLQDYYTHKDYIAEDLSYQLSSIANYYEWMEQHVDSDGNITDIDQQPQYRMLLGGQQVSGGYVAVFTCNLTNEPVSVEDAPIIGWVVLGDTSTQFSYDGLFYGSVAAEVDSVLGTDYELQVIDSDANITGRIYTYEDGSTLTCDMSDDTLVGLVYSENIFKYAEVE